MAIAADARANVSLIDFIWISGFCWLVVWLVGFFPTQGGGLFAYAPLEEETQGNKWDGWCMIHPHEYTI